MFSNPLVTLQTHATQFVENTTKPLFWFQYKSFR